MNGPNDAVPTQRVRLMQVISGAILLGLVIFLTVFLVIRKEPMAAIGELKIVSLVAAVMAVGLVPMAFIIPVVVTRAALKKIAAGAWRVPEGIDSAQFGTDSAKLLAVRQTTMIIRLALLEGPGLMGGIAYLLEGHPMALAVTGAIILLMLAVFPTEGRVRAWLEQQSAQLARLRSGIRV